MKTMGILGGLGPQATMDFVARVHRVSQSLLPQQWGIGYPPMLVHYHRGAPMKMEADFTPANPLQADPKLLAAAESLGQLVDFLVIPSNTPHLFLDEIAAAAKRPFLSIIEATLTEVQRRQWQTVGVLEVGAPRIYPDRLASLNIACKVADAPLQEALGQEIGKVMEGRDDANSRAVAQQAVANLRDKGVDGVILGCTEIPLLVDAADDLINPAQLLAETAVRYAINTA
ncbi:MAG: aspartate/glutamate racemase family protein [Chloroflexota bacterium]